MASFDSMSTEYMTRAMLEGMKSHLREALRSHFDAIATEAVQQAIDSSMKTFEVTLQQQLQPHSLTRTIEVILRDSRSKPSQ